MNKLKYAILAESADHVLSFVGLADTIGEAQEIGFDAEQAGFAHTLIIDAYLNEIQ